jgi:mRNA-degrading endonuclease toxin of MazEF toxin-antitoxin module
VRQGDIYEYAIGSRRARIVIVSAARYNPSRATFAVVLGAGAAPPPVAVMVPAADADPVQGTIDLSRLRPLDPSALRTRLGRLTQTTVRQMSQALRAYFDL